MPNPSIRLLLIAAALSFLPMLNLYYVGEEAIFPITSMEMAQHGVWLKQYLYGLDVQHNPLFNWLIIPLAELAGWGNVLVVARSLTIAATLATAATLGWLTWRLFLDRRFAAFAALIYLTFADVLMYHGWLAYVDPLFALFVFGSIAILWAACVEPRPSLLWLAAVTLTCALLSKAFTAYVFYGATFFVLALHQDYRRMLLGPVSLAAHAAMLAAPLLWFAMIPSGHSQSGRMFDEILAKLSFPGAGDYLAKLLLYPLEVWSGLLPASGLAVYFLLRKRVAAPDAIRQRHFRTALAIAGLNFLPYWLAPYSGIRYLMPIYPLFALIAAWLIWQSGETAIRTTRRWLAATIAFCFALGLFIFPYYQHKYRGENYALAADEIVALTDGQPLYVTDSTSAGLNVTAYINQRRYPQQALQFPPAQWEHGFVLSRTADPQLGEVRKKYQLLGDELYLLCRGMACTL
jgi:4-amino-4-deoxy-L-arabinose transferase-like glycosyltransferase